MAKAEIKRLPPWLRIPFSGGRARREVRQLLRDLKLNTVCEGAACPNLCECWSRRTATFMLLGAICTRNCRFCAVKGGRPEPPDSEEPAMVAEAAARLDLRYVVLTSVTRDDLLDGGSAHFAATVQALRSARAEVGIEVLTPDFQGERKAVEKVVSAQPQVFNHNLETCRRLTPKIRSVATYERSLSVLKIAVDAGRIEGVRLKSGFMLGVGEEAGDIREMLQDLKNHGVEILTIGQYLPPSSQHWPLGRYYHPDEFTEWGRIAREEYGFLSVVSAPLVRSSYQAEQIASKVCNNDL